MREKIEYSLVKLFLWLAKIAPKSFIYTMIKGLTLLVYHTDKKRRSLTITNLTMAFPEKTSEDILSLSREVYIELSRTIAEILFMFIGKFDIDKAIKNKDEVKEKIQEIEGNQNPRVLAKEIQNWKILEENDLAENHRKMKKKMWCLVFLETLKKGALLLVFTKQQMEWVTFVS